MPDVAVAERTLPHNLEAERSVLGAILLHNDAFNLAAEVIDSRDFFRDAHRRIFDKMVKLVERGDAIDLVTLKEELGRSGELDEVGGPAYIAALVDGVPRSTNVEHYARIIKEKATLRNLIFSANKILATAYEAEEEADVILDQAEHAIFAIADDKVRDGFVSLRDLAQGSLDTIEKLHSRQGARHRRSDRLHRSRRDDVGPAALRPGHHRRAPVDGEDEPRAQHGAARRHEDRHDRRHVFSLEMSKEQLFLRMLTAEARIDAHRLRGGFLGERDWGRLSQAIGTLSEAKIFIDDTPSIGVLEMRAKCRRLAAEHGLHMVIIDYIQLMQGRGRFENRTLELASISRSLKGLAKELRVPIVVLSQLSRAPESRSDHRPQLSDLRESGALEQDADVVIFIYREDMYARQERAADRRAGRRRADHRQAAQRPDRRREARLHPRVHAVREPGAGQSIGVDDPPDRRAHRSRRAQIELPHDRRLPRPRARRTRALSRSSRRTRTGTAPGRWRARSRMPAPTCSRAPTSKKARRCAPPASRPRFSSSAR